MSDYSWLPQREERYMDSFRLRLGEPVKPKCDLRLTNAEYIAEHSGKKNHYWQDFAAVFPHQKFPHNGKTVLPLSEIPLWSWCNHCGQVDENRPRCRERVFADYSSGPCGRPGIIDREGKLYCKLHDPVNVASKKAVREARWAAESEASRLKEEARRAREDLAKIALEVMEWMDASGIHNEDEWARVLYKKIEKAKEHL